METKQTEPKSNRAAHLLKYKDKAREARKRSAELRKAQGLTKRKPRNLSKIVREVLDDETIVDAVVANQPEFWSRLPSKTGGYIIATTMMVKAMSGDAKAADWIRKTGFGDKVVLESEEGFFDKTSFTVQVLPAKSVDSIESAEVTSPDIKQIEG